ncbi:MAG: carboxypeptidase-like regulatory domain-containing protein [Flavobacteriales bacterium]|nr:carboxypeptidase-like regulatory domain-containing protein [Flavobacteriales bacterium]
MKPERLIKSLQFLTLLLCSLHGFGQLDQQVSVDFQKTSATSALRDLNQRYNIKFGFDTRAMDSLEVNLQLENVKLSEVLDGIFEGSNYTYSVLGKSVVIYGLEPEPENFEPTRTNFTWRGQIRDKRTGEPLPFANIRTSGAFTVTDEMGRFILKEIPFDTSTVMINYVGYAEIKIRLTPDLIAQERSILLEQNRVLLPQAVIVGVRLPLLETTDIISTQAMNPLDLSVLSGNGEPDAMRTAQLLPGVAATLESSSGLVIRGSSADQSLVSFDGFSIYHLDHFYGIFSAFNSNAIKNMRIHKGGMDASFGGRSAGWVEITGKEGNRYTPKLQLDLSMLSLGLLFESPIGKSEKASVLVAFRRSYTDQLFTPLFRKLFNTSYNSSIAVVDDDAPNEVDIFERESDPDFRFFDLITKVSLRPNKDHSVQLSAFRGRDKLGFTYFLSSDQGRYNYAYNDDNSWGSDGIGARWQWNKGDFRLKTSIGYSIYRSSLFSNDTITDILFGLEEVNKGEFDNSLEDGRLHVDAAQSYKNHDVHLGIQANDIRTLRKSLGNSNRFEESNQKSNEVTLYLLDRWSLTKGIKLVPGLRATYYAQEEDDVKNLNEFWLEPRLNLTAKVSEKSTFKLGTGRYYQAIHRLRTQSLLLNSPDLWSMSDGKSLPLTYSDHFIGGFTWKDEGWTIDAEVFYKENYDSFENLSTYYFMSGGIDPNSDSIIVGNGTNTGLELLVQKDFKQSHLWFSYTLSESVNHFSGFQETFYRSNDQRHEAKAYFEMKGERWEWGAYFVLGSGRPYTRLVGSDEIELIDGTTRTVPLYGEINADRLPVYHRVDLSASWLFSWGKAKGKISGNVYNVYDRQNIRDIQYYSISESSNEVLFVERRVMMLGILPGLNLQLNF